MTRYEQVIAILDASVGGPSAPVGFPHAAFWRGLTRDQFVIRKVLGLPLVTVGDGAGSTLVKALKGETPFGSDLGNPNADYRRMPAGMAPVPATEIAFIEQWINDGCPEHDPAAAALTWRKTNAPIASSRTDDCWFIDPDTGWAVNSDGNILKTTDGGDSWTIQHSAPGLYLRCVAFANANVGWVGTLSPARRLLHTTDGGATWSPVTPLPAGSPVKVCGLSVVSDQVVFCSGTNDPQDVPRLLYTTDGGASWSTRDMTDHASILIDCYFVDPLHGWVVGGKADEPPPTTRNKVKPVVLETTDGGLTWTNRLAGQEAAFPLGEWGWKIQFLTDQIGFVSLENFHAAAILKTTDGGQSWTRLPVNDPQGNVNLEGVGFIDEQHGWVGGWGPGGFGSPGQPQGFSSATADSGVTWSNANEIGLYINRFRFFGQPVTVGYASGDTVYKYSSDPLPAPTAMLAAPRPLLPDAHFAGEPGDIPIRMNVPAGTRRLSLLVWDRFGAHVGCVLDEIRPVCGIRTWQWDGRDACGRPVPLGDYIVRIVADDQTASSRLTIGSRDQTAEMASPIRRGARSFGRMAAASPSRFATLSEAVQAPQHDLEWLRNALQLAVQLELATLPPYLTARWSIVDPTDPVAESIFEIRREEMLHMGLACNLLVAIDGTPLIADDAVVPKYPGELPAGVRPGLIVTLRKLDQQQAEVFMEIEYPQHGPITAAVAPPVTIGEFYSAILDAFQQLNPPLNVGRQLSGAAGLFKIDTPAKVEHAVELINLQGEGSNTSPEEAPGDLAHYYQFGEIAHGRRFVQDEHGHWGYQGDPLPMPAVHDMADIPPGGYTQAQVPDVQAWSLIEQFDREYSEMLRLLQAAWTQGQPSLLWDSVGRMGNMSDIGTQLIAIPRSHAPGNYGPCFRYVP